MNRRIQRGKGQGNCVSSFPSLIREQSPTCQPIVPTEIDRPSTQQPNPTISGGSIGTRRRNTVLRKPNNWKRAYYNSAYYLYYLLVLFVCLSIQRCAIVPSSTWRMEYYYIYIAAAAAWHSLLCAAPNCVIVLLGLLLCAQKWPSPGCDGFLCHFPPV